MMTNQEFIDGLKSHEDKAEEFAASAEAYLRLKGSGSGQEPTPEADPESLSKEAVDWRQAFENFRSADPAIRKQNAANPLTLLIGIPTAVGGAGLLYHGSKPREELGGKSKIENWLEGVVDRRSKRDPQRGFIGKAFTAATRGMHEMSKVMRQHPVKGSIAGGLKLTADALGLAHAVVDKDKLPDAVATIVNAVRGNK